MQNRWFEQLFGRQEPAYISGKPVVPCSGSEEAIAAAKEKAKVVHAQSLHEGRDMFQLDTSDPENHRLMSKANSTWFSVGKFTTPSLQQLRQQVSRHGQRCDRAPLPTKQRNKLDLAIAAIYISYEAVSDVLPLHAQHPRATFQAASQMNCLEFPNQYTQPEDGVTLYAADPTQGPACALACAAGTVYRNYFCPRELLFDCDALAPVQINDGDEPYPGQSLSLQVNNLCGIHDALGNSSNGYWRVENGYTMSNEDRLRELARVLDSINSREGGSSSGMPERMGSGSSRLETHRSAGRAGVPGAAIGGGLGVQDLDSLAALMRVGVHTNVGVNFSSRWKVCEQACHVQQVYCSACSCSYSGMSNQLWQQFARLVLQANYEATLLAAASHVDGSGHVFLTFIGGGAFRNDMNWILDAIASAVWNVSRMHVQLHVHVCHYREVNIEVSKAINCALERLQHASGVSRRRSCSLM